MFWLQRHILAKQALNSKQSAKGYERIIREILRRPGCFSMYLRMSLCKFCEYLELVGKVNFPEVIARVDSPKGNVKKHNLYNKTPRAHMSNLLVRVFPEYKSIISGDL